MSIFWTPEVAQCKPRLRRLRVIVAIVLCASLVIGAWWLARKTTEPDYRLRLGLEALRQADEDGPGVLASLSQCFVYSGWAPASGRARAERLARILDASGHPFHAHLLQGQILCKQGQYLQAMRELNSMSKFQDLMEERADLRLEAAAVLGKCLVFRKEYREAENTFGYVLKFWHEDMDPQRGKIDAHRGLFTIYFEQGALLPAMDHLLEVSKLDPRDGRAPRTMGFIYNTILRDDEHGIEYLNQALERDLSSAVKDEVRVELAEIYARRGKVDQALEVLENVGDYPKVLAIRAECLRIQDNTAEAKTLLKRALQADPRNIDSLRLMGDLHLQNREPLEAIQLLKRALEVDSHDTMSLSLLVRAYEMMSEHPEAQKWRTRHLETMRLFDEMTKLTQEAMSNPWDPAVRQRLADTCQKLEKPELAAMWTRAVKACTGAPKPGK